MGVLSTVQHARLSALADRLYQNHDLPIDADVVDQLAKIFGNTSGFPCNCGIRGNALRMAFRDEPIRTFIRLLVALDSAATGGVPTPTPNGVLPP